MGRLFFVFGSVSAWPFFLGLDGSLFLNKLPGGITSSPDFILLPVVLVCFSCLCLYLAIISILRRALWNALFYVLVLTFPFGLVLIAREGAVEAIRLLLPIICICAFALFSVRDEFVGFVKGVYLGLALFVVAHCAYVINFGFSVINSAFFWGVEIYQGLVSYSSILPLVFFAAIRQLGEQQRGSFGACFTLFNVFVCLSCIGVAVAGERKLALLGLMIFFGYALFLFKSWFSMILVGGFVLVMSFVFFTGGLGFEREVGVSYAWGQRGDAYLLALSIWQDWTSVLYGIGGSVGGFSNLFIEVFVRHGIVLGFFYFLALFGAFCFFHRSVRERVGLRSAGMWVLYVYLILSNVVNLNMLLPYFLIVFMSLILVSFPLKNDCSCSRRGHF